MKLGVCTSVSNAAAVKAAGFDYVEDSAQGLLHAHDQTDAEWKGEQLASGAALPVPAVNLMVPASHKITGPDADPAKLQAYMKTLLTRAKKVGIQTIVFGSGGARQVPEGFDRERAYAQIVAFLKAAAPVAAENGVTIVIEPLNKTECNILNGIVESCEVAKRVGHPNVKLLWDTYHFWMDGQEMRELTETIKTGLVHHVHLADKEGRVGPGRSGKNDYKPVFKVLKGGGYDGMVSIEAPPFDLANEGRAVAEYVRSEWAKA